MSKTTKGGPIFRTGHIVTMPPGMSMPPETGFTPIWEKELGLLYVPNFDAKKIDLSIGQLIRFELRPIVSPRKSNVRIAGKISNL